MTNSDIAVIELLASPFPLIRHGRFVGIESEGGEPAYFIRQHYAIFRHLCQAWNSTTLTFYKQGIKLHPSIQNTKNY